jgi:multiple sugar transport system permease protein
VHRYRRYAYAFIAPAVLIIAVTLLYPMGQGVWLSFTRVAVDLTTTFVGFTNYRTVLAQSIFWQSIGHTAFFAIVSSALTLLVGLALALLLDRRDLRMRTFWRVLFIMPWTISHVAAGLGWKWIFDSLYGVANDLLLRLHIIQEPLVWLGTRDLAMACLILANVWRSYPFVMLLLLASLQTIPREQYEAAGVDGATAWQRFRFVTLPNLKFAIFIGTALDFIFNVRQFDLIFVMTRGGPRNSTEVLATLVNRQAFEYFDYGDAAATSVLMLLLLVTCTWLYRRSMRSPLETREA